MQFSREWEKKEKRDQIIEQIRSATKISEIAKILLTIDQGFCHPHALRYVEDPNAKSPEGENSNESMEGSDSDSDNESKDLNENNEYKNVKRFKLKLFKFWPNKELR